MGSNFTRTQEGNSIRESPYSAVERDGFHSQSGGLSRYHSVCGAYRPCARVQCRLDHGTLTTPTGRQRTLPATRWLPLCLSAWLRWDEHVQHSISLSLACPPQVCIPFLTSRHPSCRNVLSSPHRSTRHPYRPRDRVRTPGSLPARPDPSGNHFLGPLDAGSEGISSSWLTTGWYRPGKAGRCRTDSSFRPGMRPRESRPSIPRETRRALPFDLLLPE